LKNSPLPSLPDSWSLSGIRSFDFSQVSDLPAAPPSFPTLPPLHQAQLRMVTEARRFNVAACGRQIGKTTLGINRIATAAEAGWPCAWLAPTYKYLDEVWRSVRDVLEPVTIARSEQQHRLAVHGGGSVECWSLDDPDAARGRKYRRVVIDEAALVRNLEVVWQASIRPTLSVLEGDAWFLSTPKGIDFFHTLFQYGLDPLQPDWAAWQMPSSANPFISPAEIEAARRELPERTFAQEYEAQFLILEGAGVFRGVHAVARLQPRRPESHHTYVFGVDWGRTNDFTVISVIDASTQEQVLLDRFSNIEYEFQTERLHRIAAAYKPRTIVAESNAMGTPIIERLQRGYVLLDGTKRPALPIWSFTTTNATKAAAIIDLSVAIEDGALTLLDDATQTAELLAYESTVLPSGMLRYAAPQGGHDDTVSALAMAYQGAKTTADVSRSRYAFGR
jgi:hypothetical protein